MPEGPEVKYLVDNLNQKLKNKVLKKININSGRYMKHGPPIGFDNFIKRLPLHIESINCKGKFIYFLFKDSEISMWNTLGMSGWWIKKKEKHNNLEFIYDNNKKIYYNDMRNFGTFKFCHKDNLEKKLNTLGADILDTDDQLELFLQRIERKRNDTFIASAILDQKVGAGVGNYIRAEALYIARISPFRKIKDMSVNELKKLWDILRQLGWYFYDEDEGKRLNIINGKYKIAAKYKKQGPSKYKPGADYFFVYRQDKDPLGNTVLHEKIGDRMIHYVKKIQK
jgi:formamidopyrimidine-DNA glycosylase